MPIQKSARIACLSAVLFSGETLAGPTGVQVAGGSAGFAQKGNLLTVTNSPGAILNWQKFSIDAGETVRFVQQNAQSAVLNRVVGKDPSAILGSLQSNGRVFLVNPNGIVFGRGARIDVAGLVASSLDIADADFAAGRLNFSGNAASRAVRNDGNIATPDGGLVYLIAPDVSNAGIVTAPNGDILLAAGRSVLIAPDASPDMRVQIAAPTDGGAVNLGELIARSGAIGIYGANVTQGGTANATAAVRGADGRIRLQATATVTAAAGSTTVADGGEIVLTSGTLTKVEKGAALRADDGRIELWSDGDTFVQGSLRARQGFIETSGKYLDLSGIDIDAAGGTWLIDPSNISIENHNVLGAPVSTCATAGSTMTCESGAAQATTHLDADIINAALNADTDVVVDTAVGSGGGGNIQLYGNLLITKSAGTAATLTLNADANIYLNGGTPTISASSGVLNVAITANRTTASAAGGIANIGSVSTNGGYFTATGSNIQFTSSSPISTGGGAITLTANNASGSTGLYLSNTLNSGGGHISLSSASASTDAIHIYSTLDAGSGYVTFNLPGGGTATDNSTGSKIVASGLELLGNNATYSLGGAPQWIGWTGRSINAPGAAVHNSAQAGNPVLTVAGNLTGTSSVYLYAGTPNIAYVSGNGMNTDLAVGSVGGTNGLAATTVYLNTANGSIGQAQKITATDLYAGAYSIVQGNTLDLSLAAGNSVTNLKSSNAMCNSGGGCTVGASASPSFKFTNATALKIAGTVDAGNGAAVIKTLTGNLTLDNVPNQGVVKSMLAGTAGNYAESIILVAGATTDANFINSNGFTPLQASGSYARWLIYSKDVGNIALGNLASPYTGSSNGGYAAYFGTDYHTTAFDGAVLPAVPADAAKPNAVILKTQPTLNVTANAAARDYGDANPAFTYSANGFVLGDTATAVTGGLASAATATSGVGAYPITLGTLTTNGYSISYTGANLTVGQRAVSIAADPQTKTYGSADPAFTYQVSAGSVVNGDVLNLTRVAGENVGTYAINLGGNPNYAVTYTGNDLGITPAVVVVVPAPAPEPAPSPSVTAAIAGNPTKNYDGTTIATLGSGNFALSGFIGGDSATISKTTGSYDSPNAGPRTVTVRLANSDFAPTGGTQLGNYILPSSASGSGTIEKAPLTVTAAAATKTYDGLAYAGGNGVGYAGFVNGETAAALGGSLAYGGTAQGATHAGSYMIVPSGLTSGNYAITYVDGKLAIHPAALTVTANDTAKTYDGLAYAGGNGVGYAGFINGETAAALGGSLAYGGTAQGATHAGSYTIVPSGLTSGNYAIAYVGGKLAIHPAALTVTANDAAKTYDGLAYAGGNGVGYAGFVNGETAAALGGSLAYGGTAQGATHAGAYVIRPSGLAPGNYAVSYVDGMLVIDKMTSKHVGALLGDTLSTAASAGTAGNTASPSSPNAEKATAKRKENSKNGSPEKPSC